ncbi:MAG: rRNA maturation factor, partial [Flavobacterium sp.]|nr:rRNA maturation factor [Flavobacterium sp.]
MVEICYQNFPDLSEVNESFINSWFFDVVSRFDKQLGDVTLIFCSDDYLLDINRTYLNHDFYTDI